MASSLRRTDVLTLSNLRNDGRKPEEIRRMRIQMGPLLLQQAGSANGSALIEMGLTIVVATVRGPMECSSSRGSGGTEQELPDRAILHVFMKMAPFATMDRSNNNSNSLSDRRFMEQAYLIQCALEASVLLHLFPRSRIEVHIMIMADDGGRLCAAINAATLALVDAGIPMKDLVCACSAGVSSNNITPTPAGSRSRDGSSSVCWVDLNRREETSSSGVVNVPCAMLPQRGTIVLTQCEARLPNFQILEQVLDAAMDGCRKVFEIMQAAIRERASTLLAARSGQAQILISSSS